MALKQNYTIKFHNKNVVFENCYFQIFQIVVAKEKATFTVYVMTESGGNVIDRKEYGFIHNLEGENFIKQAYMYLKTLPEFINAVDC